MPRSDLSSGLGFLISDLNRLMRREFDRRVRSLHLTRAQWLFIVHLVRQPGCTQSDLAESMQVEKITVSRQAARLTRAGWIRRTAHASDARAYRLQPTPKALAEIGAAWAPWRSIAAWYLWRAADAGKRTPPPTP